MDETGVLTVSEFAAAVRVSAETVYRKLERGELRGFKVGEGRTFPWRIPRVELERLLEHEPKTVELLEAS